MAEEQDQESKTEEPTEKRISDAVAKGNVPMAREAPLLGSIAATLAALLLLVTWAGVKITTVLREGLAGAGQMRLEDREAAAIHLTDLLSTIAIGLLPVMAVIAAGTIAAVVMQNAPSVAVERIRPQVARISPLAGWKRLFGKAGFVEFAKASIKIAVVAGILWYTIKRDLPRFVSALSAEPQLLPALLIELAAAALLPLLIFAVLLATADLVWSRFRWRRELRMTHHELKREMKEAEGDPYIKARLRTIRRQRSSRRMLEKLPMASMVITNPTHYAVALRYSREEGGAPVVVAKGADHMALKIREIATEHGIPLVENKPLARGLYEQVEVDTQIPPDFYRAVAEIIHYLSSRGRLPRHARPR